MTIFKLLYASKSTIPRGEAKAAIAALVDLSKVRNHNLDITGCLVFGAGRFAQVLEGEQPAVEGLMESILRDPRHTEITILQLGDVDERTFSGWALGYAGSSLFVQRTIIRPVSEAMRGSTSGISNLLTIMAYFSKK